MVSPRMGQLIIVGICGRCSQGDDGTFQDNLVVTGIDNRRAVDSRYVSDSNYK